MVMLKACSKQVTNLAKNIALALMLLSFSAGLPAKAGEWFHHSFGELRAYHGDWLNVCRLHGIGKCRTVQMPIEPNSDPFFGERRLSVNGLLDGEFRIDIFQRNMPTPPQQPIIIIDDQVFALKATDWANGEHDYSNVQETITITNPDLTRKIIAAMKAGDRFTMTYGDPQGSRQQAVFMLRGFTAAIRATETQIKNHRDNS